MTPKFNRLVEQALPTPESEVERLFKVLLPGTEFAGKAYAVGGYVRDQYLGIPSKDLDVVVEIDGGAKKMTDFIHREFPSQTTKPYNLGAYPIWQITFKDDVSLNGQTFATKGAVIEFADTMTESFPDDTSRQRNVKYGSLEDDVMRRDFTVNMLLKDLTTGQLVDMAGSKADIDAGVLRGHRKVLLDKIFADDPLRMIRLIRFHAKYGWSIPADVRDTVRRNAKRIDIVSSERIMSELTKVMKLGKMDVAVRMMDDTGLLRHVLPEIDAMKGVRQGHRFHGEGDVFQHTISVLKHAPATIEGQLAALLHDVGKPATQEIVDGAIHFKNHADVGADMAEAILHRLKFDSDTISRVKTIVKNHMRAHDLDEASPKALRKFIRDLGDEMADAVLDVAEADAKGSIPVRNGIPRTRERLREIKNSPIKVSRRAVLNGLEIMAALGINPGEKVGEATRFLLDLEDDMAEAGTVLDKETAKKELLKKFA